MKCSWREPGWVDNPTAAFHGGCRVKGWFGVRAGHENSGMPQNFIAVDRDQSFLMAPSLRDWLADDHLAWTVLAAVAEMDLDAFYGAYRPDGHGRPAYDPAMMVAVLLFAYARGNRSSRGIERECGENVAYRVLAANLVPDHSTIAEFRKRHETALAGLVGWPGASQPPAPSDPGVTVSRHRALLIGPRG